MSQVKDVVLQEFPAIGKYRVRIVKPDEKSAAILDIREYVTGAGFEGFTRRGVKLSMAQIVELADTLGVVKEMFRT